MFHKLEGSFLAPQIPPRSRPPLGTLWAEKGQAEAGSPCSQAVDDRKQPDQRLIARDRTNDCLFPWNLLSSLAHLKMLTCLFRLHLRRCVFWGAFPDSFRQSTSVCPCSDSNFSSSLSPEIISSLVYFPSLLVCPPCGHLGVGGKEHVLFTLSFQCIIQCLGSSMVLE